jgi:hypothetical protein
MFLLCKQIGSYNVSCLHRIHLWISSMENEIVIYNYLMLVCGGGVREHGSPLDTVIITSLRCININYCKYLYIYFPLTKGQVAGAYGKVLPPLFLYFRLHFHLQWNLFIIFSLFLSFIVLVPIWLQQLTRADPLFSLYIQNSIESQHMVS